MYQLFNPLIPPEVQPCLAFVRYRLRFYHIAELFQQRNFRYPYHANEVNVTHLRFTQFWTPAIHAEDLLYTTMVAPSPDTSPER